MIKYKFQNKENEEIKVLSKEKLEKRKKELEKFNREVQNQVKINNKRKILSIKYSKDIISD